MPRTRLVAVVGVLLVLIGGLAAWGIWLVGRGSATETSPPTADPVTGTAALQPAGLSLLLITEDEGEAQGFVLVRLDPVNTRLRTVAFPRETADDNGDRLFEVYDTRGAAGAAAFLRELTGFGADHCGVLTYDGLEELLNRAPAGLTFTLPENLRYDMADYTIRLDGGTQRLSPTQVTDVLRYPAWNGGRLQRTAIQAQVIAACINQFFTADAMVEDAGYNAFAGVADTDWLRDAYMAVRPTLQTLAEKNTGEICAALSLPGTYTGEGQELRFAIATPLGTALRSAFGDTPSP